MKNKGGLLFLVLLGSFVVGILLARGYSMLERQTTKPVMPVESGRQLSTVGPDTPVVLETHYKFCDHRVIGEFPDKSQIVGKTIKELSGEYAERHGYVISVSTDGTVTITQHVDALCPSCRQKRHLGLKDGKVVVYLGPSGYDREILQVTRIDYSHLPEQIKKDIAQGKMEFSSPDDLNYGLESLDEYVQ